MDFISRHHFAFVECGAISDFSLQLGQAIRCVFETECQTPSSVETVLWHIRTPRIFVACLVGAALAAAGATYQRMFKNPLVSPDILGVSSGAGLGASLAIFYNLPMFYVQLFAFSGGILAVLCVSMVASRSRNQDPILVLVLSGLLSVHYLARAFHC